MEILSDLGCRSLTADELEKVNVELRVLSDMETSVDNDVYALKTILGVED